MLRFLSSLFTSQAQHSDVDEALLEKAIERAVAGTDRRLHALPDCHKRLRQPVEQAVRHVIALVDALPAPVDISPRAFGEDPLLRAFFASTDHMGEVFRGFNSVRDYLAGLATPPEDVFGLLAMGREERGVFGMEVDGDSLRRDVMQTAVNFFNHRYLGPTGNESDTRRELKKRAFDFLVERALERLADARGKRRELDRQWHLLKRKLDAMQAGSWGLGAMLDGGEGQEAPDLAALEAEIETVEAELGQSHTDNLSLEESLACVSDILGQPADWLAARELRLRLDYRGVIVPDSVAAARDITLTELFSSTGQRRTVLLGRIARTDMPEPADFWKTAKRYL